MQESFISVYLVCQVLKIQASQHLASTNLSFGHIGLLAYRCNGCIEVTLNFVYSFNHLLHLFILNFETKMTIVQLWEQNYASILNFKAVLVNTSKTITKWCIVLKLYLFMFLLESNIFHVFT